MGSLAELLSTEDVEDCPLTDKPGCVPGSLSPPALPHVPLLLPTPCLQGDPQASRCRRGPGAPDEVEFVCPKDGTFPNLENACGSYFMCHGEKVWEVNCQPGLLFDGSIGQCNWESAVDDNCNWSEDAIAIGKKQ